MTEHQLASATRYEVRASTQSMSRPVEATAGATTASSVQAPRARQRLATLRRRAARRQEAIGGKGDRPTPAEVMEFRSAQYSTDAWRRE
jgi:hypothetical protein